METSAAEQVAHTPGEPYLRAFLSSSSAPDTCKGGGRAREGGGGEGGQVNWAGAEPGVGVGMA